MIYPIGKASMIYVVIKREKSRFKPCQNPPRCFMLGPNCGEFASCRPIKTWAQNQMETGPCDCPGQGKWLSRCGVPFPILPSGKRLHHFVKSTLFFKGN